MSKKKVGDPVSTLDKKGLDRRNFIKHGAAIGVGSAVFGTASTGPTQAQTITWDYEADIVILGSGATGLPAAIRARDLGASVIVVEQNFDIGGSMIHSNGNVSLGGGDAVQLRDLAGKGDPQGLITVPPVEPNEAMTDDPDLLFRDQTDWTVVNTGGRAPYRYNNREVLRAWADNVAPVRQFLLDNYVKFTRIAGTHSQGGLSRARRATAMFKVGAVTDVRAGTVTQDDAGRDAAGTLLGRASRFSPCVMDDQKTRGGPGIMGRGTAIARPLELSAKEKGVQFILNRHMDEIIRESQLSGRVLGIRASFTPRKDPVTGAQFVSYGEFTGGEWAKGLIKEERPTITIRARKAIIIGTGGHNGNPQFRSMFHPGALEPSMSVKTSAWLGGPGRAADASGIIAGMNVGAGLDGMEQNYHNSYSRFIPPVLATMDQAFGFEFPGAAHFPYRRSAGMNIGAAGFDSLIAVNQVGKRFFNEMGLTQQLGQGQYPQGGAIKPWNKYVQGDWRSNASPAVVKEVYNDNFNVDAALAINEGSQAPHFLAGPVWAIFDSAAVARRNWDIKPPYTGDDGFFFKADTIEDLAVAIQKGNEHQRVPLKYLKETVAKWNSFVEKGADPDFDRGPDAPMYAIATPPFYAARIIVESHDSCGGLRINGKAQVLDMKGQVIPGLYAGGEASGAHLMHGLGKACTHGYIAGTNAVNERA